MLCLTIYYIVITLEFRKDERIRVIAKILKIGQKTTLILNNIREFSRVFSTSCLFYIH